MKEDQFMALAELLRMRGGASQEAARLVLVKGLSTTKAAQQVGIGTQAVSNVLASCKRGLELARRATQDDA